MLTPEPDLSLQHLLAALSRIDVLIQREVRRWRLAGQDPADDFRGLYVTDLQAEALLGRKPGTSWGQAVALPAQEEQQFALTIQEHAGVIERLAARATQAGQSPRLEQLCAIFGLDAFERDALLICLAPALDLRYEKLYGYLQDDVTRKRPGVNLVLDLLCEPGLARLEQLLRFSDEAPLIRHHLLERTIEGGQGKASLLSQALVPDETIVAWLLGSYQPRPGLRPYITFTPAAYRPVDELLAGEAWEQLRQAPAQGLVPVLYGPDQAARLAAAHLLAAHLACPLISLNLAAVAGDEESPAQILRLAARDARLTGAMLYLENWDALLANGAAPGEILGDWLDGAPRLIFSSPAPWLPHGFSQPVNLAWYEFPLPAYPRRLELWKFFLHSFFDRPATSAALPGGDLAEIDLEALAGQFHLTGGQIRDAAATARDAARQSAGRPTGAGLFAAARAHSNPRLSSLAHKIKPRYTWDDIILPADQLALLQEIVATVRQRSHVLEEWGLGMKLVPSWGVTVLFAGPPGTGKTMAAEVIANELGLDLYKIDLSSVVSKYIGETEKNLERIFGEAASSNAILFFDEADALFGRRSEVRDSHDRYANIEISYLLQRMEAYNGVTILATNLRANLDEAFTRRLQFAVDFPFPEDADRLRIWQTLLPPQAPYDPQIDWRFFATRFKLAGGNIRNILVSAAYLAASDGGQVTMAHLLHSTRRELQKMGRMIDESQFTC